MKRFSVDEFQSGRVKQTALNFLRKVKNEWGLEDSTNQRLLEWAADLHEIEWMLLTPVIIDMADISSQIWICRIFKI